MAVTAEGFAIPAIPQRQTPSPSSASLKRPMSPPSRETAAPEDVLIARCAQGDRAAQKVLFTRLRPQVMRHVSYLVRRRAEVDDISQEVFLEVFRSLPSFQGRSSFSTWVHRITVRATYRHLRRQWKGEPPPEIKLDEGEPQADADPSANAEIRDRHARALAILEKLSPKKRMVLLMHDLQGLEAAEIARLVGAPVLTVRTRLFYARRDFAAAARGDPALAEYFDGDNADEVSEASKDGTET
jgi:RNA polymerase sigma-70 factor (ECF subfamily)